MHLVFWHAIILSHSSFKASKIAKDSSSWPPSIAQSKGIPSQNSASFSQTTNSPEGLKPTGQCWEREKPSTSSDEGLKLHLRGEGSPTTPTSLIPRDLMEGASVVGRELRNPFEGEKERLIVRILSLPFCAGLNRERESASERERLLAERELQKKKLENC